MPDDEARQARTFHEPNDLASELVAELRKNLAAGIAPTRAH